MTPHNLTPTPSQIPHAEQIIAPDTALESYFRPNPGSIKHLETRTRLEREPRALTDIIREQARERRSLLTPFPFTLLHRKQRTQLKDTYPLTHAIGNRKNWHRFARNLTRTVLTLLSEEKFPEPKHQFLGLEEPLSTEAFSTLVTSIEALVKEHGKHIEFPLTEHHLSIPCKTNTYDDGGIYIAELYLPGMRVPLFVKKWDRLKEFERAIAKQNVMARHTKAFTSDTYAIHPYLFIDQDALITVEPFIDGIPFRVALELQCDNYYGKRDLFLAVLHELNSITARITRTAQARHERADDNTPLTIADALNEPEIPRVINYDNYFLTKFIIPCTAAQAKQDTATARALLDDPLLKELAQLYTSTITTHFTHLPPFLNHGDLNFGNILITKRTPATSTTMTMSTSTSRLMSATAVRFIDWEGAFIGNVIYDIVELLKKAPLHSEEENSILADMYNHATIHQLFTGTQAQFLEAYRAMQTHQFLASAAKYITKARHAQKKEPARADELMQQANYNYTRALNNIRGTTLEEKLKQFNNERCALTFTDLEAEHISPELDPDEQPSFANYADVSITESTHASDRLRKIGKKIRNTIPYVLTTIAAIAGAFGVVNAVQYAQHASLVAHNKQAARTTPFQQVMGEENKNWYWSPLGATSNHDGVTAEDITYALTTFTKINKNDIIAYLVAAPIWELDAVPHYLGNVLPEEFQLKKEYFNDTRQVAFMIAKQMSDAQAKGYDLEDQYVAARIGMDELEQWKQNTACSCGNYYHYSRMLGFPEEVRMHVDNAINTRGKQ